MLTFLLPDESAMFLRDDDMQVAVHGFLMAQGLAQAFDALNRRGILEHIAKRSKVLAELIETYKKEHRYSDLFSLVYRELLDMNRQVHRPNLSKREWEALEDAVGCLAEESTYSIEDNNKVDAAKAALEKLRNV